MKQFFASIVFATILASCNTCTVKPSVDATATEAVDTTGAAQDTTAVAPDTTQVK